jgi:hypothetical protein
VIGYWVKVPYYTYAPSPDGSGSYLPAPPTPDDEPGWEWTEPVPWVNEFGIWNPGFGVWTRPRTRAEMAEELVA